MRFQHLIVRAVVTGLVAVAGVVGVAAPAAAASLSCNTYPAPNPYLPQLSATVCLEHFGYNGSPIRVYAWVTNYHPVVTVAMQVSMTGATTTGSAICSKALLSGQSLACTGSNWGLPSPIAKGKLTLSSYAPGQPMRFHTVYSPQRT